MKLIISVILLSLVNYITCSDFFLPPFITSFTDSVKNEGCFIEIYGLKIRDKDSYKREKPIMFALLKDQNLDKSSSTSTTTTTTNEIENKGEYEKALEDFHLFLANSGYIRNLKDFEKLFNWVDENDYMKILLSNGYDKDIDYCLQLHPIDSNTDSNIESDSNTNVKDEL